VIKSDNFECFVPVCHVFNGNRHKPYMIVHDLFKQSIADILQMINFKYFGHKHRNT